MSATHFSATVSVTPQVGRKVRHVSRVVIWLGDKAVCEGTFGGKYTQYDALREFHKNRKRFTFSPAFESLKG